MQAGFDILDNYFSGKHNHLMTALDNYLTTVEPVKRKELERIRALAKQAVPGAEEAIVYGMPTLKYQGKPFLGFDTLIERTLEQSLSWRHQRRKHVWLRIVSKHARATT